jgi:cytochrome P450
MPTPAYDPLSELSPANRGRIYAELREERPVYWSSFHAAWVLTRYADVKAIFYDPDSLAPDGVSFLQSVSRRGNLDLSDLIAACSSISFFIRPPKHDAIRRLLAQSIGSAWRLNLPELLKRRADLLLDCGEREGSIDLAGGYGKALALFVIGSFLGIPEEDLPQLGEMALGMNALFERNVPSVNSLIALNKFAGSLMDYFGGLIALRRQNPGVDGISLMVRMADEQLGCSEEQLAGYCTFFFVAAEETTAASISGAALLLLQHPALRARLTSDPSLVPHAVRELLRLVSPVQFVARQMRVGSQVADQLIPADERVMLMLGAANRDPAAFPNPDEIDLYRSGPEPLVFGAGPYRCIGAQLATFEVDVAVRTLLERPQLRLSPQSPAWIDRMNIAPLRRLQANFESS